jgi:uncharacterized protein YdaU (DUF1376 family)
MVGFYKHDIPAWMDGTENLSDAAYRAYHVVVQLIMLNEGPITPNDRGIAGRCNQTVKTFTKALAELLDAGKLTLRDGRICNARAAAELSFVEKNRENAGKGGKTRAFREKARENERSAASKPLENKDAPQAPLEAVPSLKDETRLDKTVEKEATPLPLLVTDDFPDDGFEQWWKIQPNKVAKPAAEKAFNKVRKLKLATYAQLMGGLLRYIATKPEHYDWCHPTTWLNQGRWADQPAPTADRGTVHPFRPRQSPADDRADALQALKYGGQHVSSLNDQSNFDLGPVIEHQSDVRSDRDVPRAIGGGAGRLPQESYRFVAGAERR